jgi:parvulin-like peptidyl-prolyl isomerase
MASADDTLSCVNKECITKSDVMKVAEMRYGAKEYEALNKKVKKKILKGLQDKLLVVDAAKKAKLEESAEYKKAMGNASKAILSNLYLKKLKEQITVEPNEISAYYRKHKDMYYTRVHTRTILNSSEEKIKTLIAELQKVKPDERKEAFIKLAKKYSQHPSRHKEGDLGFIGYSSMVQPFGKETFKLKDNEMTELPVKTTLGYHIIYVEERKVKPLEEVKVEIENTLREKKYRETFRDRLKNLREKAEITL